MMRGPLPVSFVGSAGASTAAAWLSTIGQFMMSAPIWPATSYPRIVMVTMVSGDCSGRTPSVLGSWTTPFGATAYCWQNLMTPFASTSMRMASGSFVTTICVETPGTSSVGSVPLQPVPVAAPAIAIASALHANVFAPNLRICQTSSLFEGEGHAVEAGRRVIRRERARNGRPIRRLEYEVPRDDAARD